MGAILSRMRYFHETTAPSAAYVDMSKRLCCICTELRHTDDFVHVNALRADICCNCSVEYSEFLHRQRSKSCPF